MQRSDAAEKMVRPVILSIPVERWHSDSMITFITRKLGHFAEFFALGAGLMGLALILRPALQLRGMYLFLFAVCIAAIDESLQLTSGRGAAVSDVALDAFGALAGLLAVALGAILFAKGKTKRA